MARSAKPNNRTTLRYITPEDSAIGLTDDERKDGWGLYTETLNEAHLKLVPGEAPSYYYLKCLTLDAQQRLVSAIAGDDEDTRSVFERCFSPEVIGEMKTFLDTFLVGCTFHEEVTEVLPDGTTVTRSFAWVPGTPRPDGLIDSILADQVLTFNLFMFCSSASRLSEKEKKQ